VINAVTRFFSLDETVFIFILIRTLIDYIYALDVIVRIDMEKNNIKELRNLKDLYVKRQNKTMVKYLEDIITEKEKLYK